MKTAKFLTASVITRTAGPPMPEPFRQLCTLEPGLAELWADATYYARHWAARPEMCKRGKDAAWRGIKGEMARLVGWRREDRDDILGSIQAYDCAYKALLDALGA